MGKHSERWFSLYIVQRLHFIIAMYMLRQLMHCIKEHELYI